MTGEIVHRRDDGSLLLAVHVVPGAGRNEIVGRHGEALKIRVAAPPEGGRANQAIIDLLAEVLELRGREITLVAGGRSRFKRIQIAAHSAAGIDERLRALLDD